ncbi:uncharacterized protein TNCT_126771 [Trichonephila clavata]|uniref:Uncharacterized protein n=1 Tax=Trichonephila clavata TaxID=2740835 RepID=A0A8X6GR74_TRICU|nr:uncharacterized protein TNCT_126771 [Trichonephila clavata]
MQMYGDASTYAAGAVEIMQVDDEIDSMQTLDCVGIDWVRSSFLKTYWVAASSRFPTMFVNNPFKYKCDVCVIVYDFAKEKHLSLLNNTFSEELVADFKLCAMCKNSLDSHKMLTFERICVST